MEFQAAKYELTQMHKGDSSQRGFQEKEKKVIHEEKKQQQKIRLLNLLVSDNNKLKEEVNK